MFKIRPEHIRTFQPQAEAAFTRQVMEYIRKTHSEAIVKLPAGEKAIGELSANVLRKMVEGGIAQSRQNGLNLKSAMISFVTTMVLTAPNFDEHPIAKQLLEEAAKLANQSFDTLLDEMTDEHWAEVEKNQNPKAWNAPLDQPKLIEEAKPVEAAKTIEEAKPIEKTSPVKEEKTAEVMTLGGSPKPAKKRVKKPLKKAQVKEQVKDASRTQHAAPIAPKQPCPNKNWIDLIYKTTADRPVAGAGYIITDASGQQIASGALDQRGFAHVGGLPDGLTSVNITYTGDPKPFEIFNDKKPIRNPYYDLPPKPAEVAAEQPNKYLAAAAEAAAPVLELAAAYHRVQMDVGKWTWGAIMGDWNDDQTLGQIVFDSAVTMIPVVDQVGDVRDLTANLYQLTVKKKYNEFGPWFGFVMTLIGLVPEVGTAIKGAVKCVVRVGKNAAGVIIQKGVKFGEQLIQKSGFDIDGLIRVMNGFGEGNAVRWLSDQVENFGELKRFAKETGVEILLALKTKCLELKDKVFESVAKKLDSIIKSIDEVLSRAAEFIGEIMERARQELKEIVERVKNYFFKGTTQTQNGAIQIADELPTSAVPAGGKTRHKMPEIDMEKLRKVADDAGMEPEELVGLLNHCNGTNRRVIVRFTNPDSLKWHGKAKHVPKSVDVKLKTSKSGDNAGLVVRPKEPMEDWEIENIDALKKKGYEFDFEGVLVDNKRNRIYGDYDLQAVHSIDPNTGKATDLMTSPSNSVVAEVNGGMGRKDRKMLEQRAPVQHGAENDFHIKTETVPKKDAAGNVVKDANGKPVMETKMVYEKPVREFDLIRDPKSGQMIKVKAAPGKPVPAKPEDIAAGNSTLGKQYGDDEKYLVVNPDGTTEILKNPHELYELNRKSGLPWRYDAVPPTGEQLAAAQAKKQAKKEQMEQMAAAEARAEQSQMKTFIDDIVGDGRQFDGVSLKSDGGAKPFWDDNSLDVGAPGNFNAAAVKDNGAVPWGI